MVADNRSDQGGVVVAAPGLLPIDREVLFLRRIPA